MALEVTVRAVSMALATRPGVPASVTSTRPKQDLLDTLVPTGR